MAASVGEKHSKARKSKMRKPKSCLQEVVKRPAVLMPHRQVALIEEMSMVAGRPCAGIGESLIV